MRSNNALLFVLAAGMLLIAGCVSSAATAFPLGDVRHPPKAAGARVEIFTQSKPTRKFAPVAKLNVHIEKTFFIPSAFDEARPQLEELARNHGADALIQIEEAKSRLNETFIYNVTAVAVVFTE